MEEFGSLRNNPQSPLSRAVAAQLPEVQNRVQGILNLYSGAFSNQLYADIVRALNTFDVQTAMSGIIDAGSGMSDDNIKNNIARSFADYLDRETEQTISQFNLDSKRDHREAALLTQLIGSIRGIE